MPAQPFHEAKNILVTGAGGYIGSALVRSLATSSAGQLILLDNSERNLYQIELELAAIPNCPPHLPILGDLCDSALLEDLLEKNRPEFVYHAAALKHVPLMEKNPIAAVRTNAIGTHKLAEYVSRYSVNKLIMISTDKAVNPLSIMGASKRIAELALLHSNNSGTKTRMKSLRLANVWGSTGSVVPLFQQQILQEGPVTITHQGASRYFLNLSETVDLILALASLDDAEGVFVPKVGEPVKITEVARKLIETADPSASKAIPIVFTGLRPGEKLTEELISVAETVEPTPDSRLLRVLNVRTPPPDFDAQMRKLAEAVNQHDLAAVFETCSRLVPEYRPSEYLLGSLHPFRA